MGYDIYEFKPRSAEEIAEYIYKRILYVKEIWRKDAFKNDVLKKLLEFGTFSELVYKEYQPLNLSDYYKRKNNLFIFETNFDVKTVTEISEATAYMRLYIKSTQQLPFFHYIITSGGRIYNVAPILYYDRDEFADGLVILVNQPENHKASKLFSIASFAVFLELLSDKKVDITMASEIYPEEKNILKKEDITDLKMEALIFAVFRLGVHFNLFKEAQVRVKGSMSKTLKKVKLSDEEWKMAAKTIINNYLSLINILLEKDVTLAKILAPIIVCAEKIKEKDLTPQEAQKIIFDIYTFLKNSGRDLGKILFK